MIDELVRSRPAPLIIIEAAFFSGVGRMTEAEIKAEVRLWALECVVSQLCASLLLKLPDGVPEMMHQQLIDGAKKNVFPKVNPALSDHYSAEFESAIRRLVRMQQEYMVEGRKSP